MKFTAGTNLTAPEAGAVEFDGTNLFVTLSDGTRRSLTNMVANVRDFGAKGDGVTDDSQAFRDAVASLVNAGVGGVVWVPPQGVYKINDSIEILSSFPIWIVSAMHHGSLEGPLGGPGISVGGGYIQPGDEITGGLFRWTKATGTTVRYGAGGGMRGIHIADPPTSTDADGRITPIDAAVFIEDANYFTMEDCYFSFLAGTAVKVGAVTVCRINHGRIYRCGEMNKPSVHIDGNEDFAGAYIFDLITEGSYNAPYLKTEDGTSVNLRFCYFEGMPELPR